MQVLSVAPDVTEISNEGWGDHHEDVRIWFKHKGIKCLVWEPFGDGDVYWLGPLDENDFPAADFTDLHKLFSEYEGPVQKSFRRLRGVLSKILNI